MSTVRSYDEAVPFLISRVPGFADALAEMRDFFGDDVGSHLVMGEFTRYVEGLFRSHLDDGPGRDELRAAFDVIEAFAASQNVEVKELAGVSFLENLDPDLATAMLPWMGPASRQLLDAIERFWRGE